MDTCESSQHGTTRSRRSRADNQDWPLANQEIFINIMHDEWMRGRLLGLNFPASVWKDIWIAMQSNVNLCVLRPYTLEELKGKMKRIKVSWRRYHAILVKQTGWGWDNDKKTICAPDDAWNAHVQQHPEDAQLRSKPFPCYHECTDMWGNKTARGESAFSSRQIPLDSEDEQSMPDVGNATSATGSGQSSRPAPSWMETSNSKKSKNNQPLDRGVDSWAKLNQAKLEKLENKKKETKIGAKACIEALSSMSGLDQNQYFKAIEKLRDSFIRDIFINMPEDMRRAWVESLP